MPRLSYIPVRLLSSKLVAVIVTFIIIMKDTTMRQAPESTISSAQAHTELANTQTDTNPVESTALANAQTGSIPVCDCPQESAAPASVLKDSTPACDLPQGDIALASAQDTTKNDVINKNVSSNGQDIMMEVVMEVDDHRSAEVDLETGATGTDMDDWAMVDRKSLLSVIVTLFLTEYLRPIRSFEYTWSFFSHLIH